MFFKSLLDFDNEYYCWSRRDKVEPFNIILPESHVDFIIPVDEFLIRFEHNGTHVKCYNNAGYPEEWFLPTKYGWKPKHSICGTSTFPLVSVNWRKQKTAIGWLDQPNDCASNYNVSMVV